MAPLPLSGAQISAQAGISIQTNNQNEIDPNTGKIFGIVQRYFHEQLGDLISQMKAKKVILKQI